MTDPNLLASRYLAAWNETDAARRGALLAESWSDDCDYADPMMRASGRDQVDGLIGAVHARFPAFRFTLKGHADGHGDHLRFSWALGPEGADSVIEGTDFARLDGDRFRSVIGFLDRAPAQA